MEETLELEESMQEPARAPNTSLAVKFHPSNQEPVPASQSPENNSPIHRQFEMLNLPKCERAIYRPERYLGPRPFPKKIFDVGEGENATDIRIESTTSDQNQLQLSHKLQYKQKCTPFLENGKLSDFSQSQIAEKEQRGKNTRKKTLVFSPFISSGGGLIKPTEHLERNKEKFTLERNNLIPQQSNTNPAIRKSRNSCFYKHHSMGDECCNNSIEKIDKQGEKEIQGKTDISRLPIRATKPVHTKALITEKMPDKLKQTSGYETKGYKRSPMKILFIEAKQVSNSKSHQKKKSAYRRFPPPSNFITPLPTHVSRAPSPIRNENVNKPDIFIISLENAYQHGVKHKRIASDLHNFFYTRRKSAGEECATIKVTQKGGNVVFVDID